MKAGSSPHAPSSGAHRGEVLGGPTKGEGGDAQGHGWAKRGAWGQGEGMICRGRGQERGEKEERPSENEEQGWDSSSFMLSSGQNSYALKGAPSLSCACLSS